MELKDLLKITLELAYKELAFHEMKQYEETREIDYWTKVTQELENYVKKINSAS